MEVVRISPGRVQQIVKNADRDARRRSELERKYGFRPEIAALPDSTPLEVLHAPARDGTRRVVDAAIKSGVRRVVLTSSVAAATRKAKLVQKRQR